MKRRLAAALVFACAAAAAAPLTIPFDFSRGAIGLDVTVKGKPLYMMLDTGLDPSGIDLAQARALSLPLDTKAAGEGDGEGNGTARVIPSTIKDLKFGGQGFGDVAALAMDMKTISAAYGRPLGGILGYSFLKGKRVAIDYPARRLSLFAGAAEAASAMRTCRTHYTVAMRMMGDENFPLIPVRFGAVTAPATLDTGSNRFISLFQPALKLKGVREALKETGKAAGTGVRGNFTSPTARLNLPVAIGPFTLPAGTQVAVMPENESARVANVGNQTFAALKLRLLLDYAGRTITFYGDCGR